MIFSVAVQLLVIVVGALLYGYGWILPVSYRLHARKHKTGIPFADSSYPFGLPTLLRFKNAVKEHQVLHLVRKEHIERKKRTFMREMLGDIEFVTYHPENIKTILATNFKDFSLDLRHRQLGPVFGDGIFTLSGEAWKHSRAMLRPQFARDQITRLDSVSNEAMNLIQSIITDQKSGFIDLQRYFHLLTMDTATHFLFGQSIQSLHASSSARGSEIVTPNGERISSVEFVESYTFLNEYGLRRVLHGKLCWTQNSEEFRRHRERARKFIDYFVDRALKATSSPEAIASLDPDRYIFAYELAKVSRDPIVIRDQIFNILIAGRDTTASTMSFIFYYMAKYPEVYDQVREEILLNFGAREEQREITFESLKQSRWLNAVINETMRLAPIVSMNSRTAIRDTILPVGGGPNEDQPVFVPKGKQVQYSVFLMHRDPMYWGSDAAEFKPERWFEPKQTSHPWAFLPFNGGPRICLGQQFALSEISMTLVRLLQTFSRIEKGPDFCEEEPRWSTGLTLHQHRGLQVKLH